MRILLIPALSLAMMVCACSTKPGASAAGVIPHTFPVHKLPSEPRLGEVIEIPDEPDFRAVTEAAQSYPALLARYDGITYTIAFDANRHIAYVATDDSAFTTPEGVHVGTPLSDVLHLGAQQPWVENGWGFHTELPSGWNVAFVQGESLTDEPLHPNAAVRWLFKRMRGAA